MAPTSYPVLRMAAAMVSGSSSASERTAVWHLAREEWTFFTGQALRTASLIWASHIPHIIPLTSTVYFHMVEEYRQSRDKEKFLRGHEGEIILFEAAARELKRLDAVPLPATKRLRAEMDGLTARRTALQSEYRKAQREEREYDTLRQNVEALLEKPREAEPQRQRNHELE